MATISPRKVENCCSIRTQFKSNIAAKKSFSYLFEHFTFCICAHRIFLIYCYGGCTNDSISLQAYGIRFIKPRVCEQNVQSVCVYVGLSSQSLTCRRFADSSNIKREEL